MPPEAMEAMEAVPPGGLEKRGPALLAAGRRPRSKSGPRAGPRHSGPSCAGSRRLTSGRPDGAHV